MRIKELSNYEQLEIFVSLDEQELEKLENLLFDRKAIWTGIILIFLHIGN